MNNNYNKTVHTGSSYINQKVIAYHVNGHFVFWEQLSEENGKEKYLRQYD